MFLVDSRVVPRRFREPPDGTCLRDASGRIQSGHAVRADEAPAPMPARTPESDETRAPRPTGTDAFGRVWPRRCWRRFFRHFAKCETPAETGQDRSRVGSAADASLARVWRRGHPRSRRRFHTRERQRAPANGASRDCSACRRLATPHGRQVPRQPLITLWTVATIGGLSSIPAPVRIGRSVSPNASKAACDSQMSKT